MSTANPECEAEAEIHADNLLQSSISLKDKAKAKAQKILHLLKILHSMNSPTKISLPMPLLILLKFWIRGPHLSQTGLLVRVCPMA